MTDDAHRIRTGDDNIVIQVTAFHRVSKFLHSNDIRTGLVCFGTDATHGYERTHLSSLEGVARLLTSYMRSDPVVPRDRKALGPVEGFPNQPMEEAPHHDKKL